jgi:hypothetical protein
VRCPQCDAENSEGKKFCADCGSLLETQLEVFIRSQVRESVQARFKDQKLVEIETTEAIVARIQKWATWFLIPATVLYTILAAILAVLGFTDYTRFHRVADAAVREATTAKDQALEAQREAILAKATIDGAKKNTDENMRELGNNVKNAEKEINEQRNKLATTDNFVTASLLDTKGEAELFKLTSSPRIFQVTPFHDRPQGGWLFMLLKKVPVFQTIQLQTAGRTLEPKWTYTQEGNVLIFRWASPIKNLDGTELQVGYVPNPRVPEAPYISLSRRGERVVAEKNGGGLVDMPEFPSQYPSDHPVP